MGHVDHGKTSLLDAIRETEVAAGEAGGITQHIGAYQVHHDRAPDHLPRHAGPRGLHRHARPRRQVTDIAVIVVAADDGVMPQTVEAIDHAKAADVPIMVAVNKIDKEGADPNRVRGELAQQGLTPADWGGDTEFVDVSAKTRQNLDELLETLITLAEIQELKANPGHGGLRRRDRVAARPRPRRRGHAADPPRPHAGRRRARGRRALRPRPRDARLPRREGRRRPRPACRSRCSASTACPRPASTSAWSTTSARRAAWPRSAPTA